MKKRHFKHSNVDWSKEQRNFEKRCKKENRSFQPLCSAWDETEGTRDRTERLQFPAKYNNIIVMIEFRYSKVEY
jgi:hypothetical protein